MTTELTTLDDYELGFNPCFGGSYIVTYTPEKTKNYETLGFNPCFGGSYIVTLELEEGGNSPFLFQSLFWWILYCDIDAAHRKQYV